MTTALSHITVLPSTKAEITNFVELAVNEILSGEYNPLKIEVQLKAMEETIKSIRGNKDVKDQLLEEASKYPDKTFEFAGAKITKSSRSTYDFSACGDSVWNEMSENMAKMKDVIKAREAMLMTGLNPETGETFQKPTQSTSEYLTITLK